MRFALHGYKNKEFIWSEDHSLAELVDIGWGWLECGWDVWLYDRELDKLTMLRLMVRMDLYDKTQKTKI